MRVGAEVTAVGLDSYRNTEMKWLWDTLLLCVQCCGGFWKYSRDQNRKQVSQSLHTGDPQREETEPGYWPTFIPSASRRLRQEDVQLKTSLGYTVFKANLS